ncbi:ABC transporter permease [Nocardioides cavernaquae]|uniref:ABC transporter permease n=1 Tax=Nocardioides cavernaquae TaxID=2321396 RepID=A0A3A5H7W3_9ACTN|nr:ABC transporter permease [Nocardioides cavernaquae]RJS46542.1 ABC transporter permease [Nocardioides cavernaquae]
MTVANDIFTPSSPPAVEKRRPLPVWVWTTGVLLLALVLISTARVITGSEEVDSSGTLREAIMAIVPIALAALAGLWSERAGIVNIGLEGMMILGTIGAGYFGFWYGPWAGVAGAIAFGALGGLLHAIATVWMGVDHIVSGVAITIMAGGVAAYLAATWFTGLPGGNPTASPPVENPGTITLAGVADAARSVEDKHWWLVSDLASILGALTRGMSVLTMLAVVLIVATYFILWRTSFGLRLRSCGESPATAESLGVNVYRYKTIAVVMSGALSGLAGAFIVLAWAGSYSNDMTNGRGYLGLAAMIFGNWRPGGLLVGSALFGYTDALQLRAGGGAVHALLLVIAVVLGAYAVWQFVRGARIAGAVTAVTAVAVLAWFLLTDEVPEDFTRMTPYVLTLFVLAFAAQRLRMPAADGQIYRKGSAG